MSIRLINAAFDAAVPPLHKLVLLTLSNHANTEGVCRLSLKGLAVKCGIDIDRCQSFLAELIEAGAVTPLAESVVGWRRYRVNEASLSGIVIKPAPRYGGAA